ncbi:MAG TPA: hypothetical protein VGK94_02080 [Candidatus Polarisedimenticolia bacterium]|jgi:hypothetical protein
MSRQGAGLAVTLLILGAGLAWSDVRGGAVEVQIKLPAPQKIDTTGMSRVLVGGFRAGDHPTLNLEREINRSLRALLRKNTKFEILDVEPLPLPEQPIEEAIRNTAYWVRLGARFNADLILAGTLEFTSTDQSGFVQEDLISELTGQRVRRSRWVQRESFQMELGLYFFRGSSGELVYEDHFTEEAAFDGKGNDALSALHQLIDRIGESVLSIITTRSRLETRYLFTE